MVEAEETTKSGIILAGSAKEKPEVAEIVAVGPGGLVDGKEVYQGKNYMDGKYLQKAAPRTKRYETPRESKIVDSIVQALQDCGAKSGMTFSFHHHLRDGDYVVNLVMKSAIEELGLEDALIEKLSWLGNQRHCQRAVLH